MDSSHPSNANFYPERHLYSSSGASSTRYILGGPSSSTGEQQHGLQIHHGPVPERRLAVGHFQANSTCPQTVANLTSSLSIPNAMMQHADSDSNLTNLSTRSAPQPARSSSSSSAGGGGSRGTPANRRSSQRQQRLDFERGYLKISAHMVDEIIKYRRMLCLLVLSLLYGLIALGAIIFGSSPSLHSSAGLGTLQRINESAWTQEMIVGWHRERALSLADEYTNTAGTNQSRPDGSARHLKVRECRSRAQLQHQHQQAHHQLATNLSLSSGGAGAHNRTQEPATRRRRKFEALNGCFFRREASSESMGDLCCCAGIPRYVLINDQSTDISGVINDNSKNRTSNATISSTTTSKPTASSAAPLASTISTTKSSTALNVTRTTSRPRRKYLRPQVLCFVSGAANLFNAQKLIAPVANEYNLRHSFIKGKGKCITCSCCHEHEPEKVNKLLANVPLYNHKPRSLMIDKNGNQLVRPASQEEPQREVGLWVRMRDHLSSLMRQLDNLFFWMYELLEAALLTARYGSYPATSSDSTGLLLIQSSLARPNSFELAHVHATVKLRPAEAPSLYIDDDTYDDFTTTTTTTTTSTTTTTTTTTVKPKSHRRKGSKRRRRPGKRVRTTGSPAGSSTSTTSSPGTTSNAVHLIRTTSAQLHSSSSLPIKVNDANGESTKPKVSSSSNFTAIISTSAPAGVVARILSTSSPTPLTSSIPPAAGASSTTTKSPTVIINVYAGNNHQADGSSTTTSTSTTTTSTSRAPSSVRPTITLIAETNKLASASGGNDIELHIKLNSATNLSNSSSTTTTTTATPTSTRQANALNSPGDSSGSSSSSASLPYAITHQGLPSVAAITTTSAISADRYRSTSGGSLSSSSIPQSSTASHVSLSTPQANSTKSIVISLGQGNSTTIIATINTTRLDSELPPTSNAVATLPALSEGSAGNLTERPPLSLLMSSSPISVSNPSLRNLPAPNDQTSSSLSSSSQHKPSTTKTLNSPAPKLNLQIPAADTWSGTSTARLATTQQGAIGVQTEPAAPTSSALPPLPSSSWSSSWSASTSSSSSPSLSALPAMPPMLPK